MSFVWTTFLLPNPKSPPRVTRCGVNVKHVLPLLWAKGPVQQPLKSIPAQRGWTSSEPTHIHTHSHTHTHTGMHTNACRHAHTDTRTYTQAYICTHANARRHAHTWAHAYTCMRAHTNTHRHTYRHTHTNTYTHPTHTHTGLKVKKHLQ